jgi:hypothetical protein
MVETSGDNSSTGLDGRASSLQRRLLKVASMQVSYLRNLMLGPFD